MTGSRGCKDRAMSDKPQTAVGLDLGSAWTRCLILSVVEGRLRYAVHSEVQSSGWNKGRLVDQQAVTACIRNVVREAEAKAGVSVEAMVVGIGGSSVEGSN